MGQKTKILKRFFIISILVVIFWGLYQSFLQYQIWSENDLSKFLLPPYKSIGYFLKYSFLHFFQSHLISLGAGILFLWGATKLNKRFEKRFFEEDESYLGVLAMFMMGQPWWMVYFVIVMAVGVLGTFFPILKTKISGSTTLYRFPFYYFWIPVAIIILIGKEFWFT
jgi:hypothetical protein